MSERLCFDFREDEDTVERVERLLGWAVEQRASDLHLEPRHPEGEISIRVDGVLFSVGRIPLEFWESTLTRLKILSDLPVYVRERPQDGRLRFDSREGRVQGRLAVLPTLHGEKVVVRFFDLPGQRIDWPNLGLSRVQQEQLLAAASRRQGLILLTGPSGSGKTTTIYAFLERLVKDSEDATKAGRVNVATLEDPVERELEFASQTEIRPRLGLAYAECLRTLLRQDPEIIVVGEIRDPETARITMRAALTGHLVISTIHSADTAEVFLRLLDMDVEPYLVAGCVSAVFGQRLVRKRCEVCSEEEAKECPHCAGTGYRGRTLVGELLTPDEALRELVLNKAPIRALRRAAHGLIAPRLLHHAREKCALGLTTIEEVNRLERFDSGLHENETED